VNVPGVMAILVAPVVAQLNVLLAPEFMPVGFAAKEVIAGAEAFSVDEFDEPQFTRPTQANKMTTRAQRSEALKRILFLQKESLIRNPSLVVTRFARTVSGFRWLDASPADS